VLIITLARRVRPSAAPPSGGRCAACSRAFCQAGRGSDAHVMRASREERARATPLPPGRARRRRAVALRLRGRRSASQAICLRSLSPPPPTPLTDFNMVRIACPRLALPALRARRWLGNGPSALAMRRQGPAQQRTGRQGRAHRTASLCCTAWHCLPHRRSSKAAAVLRLCGSTLPRGAAALANGRSACCWREAGMSGAARLGPARPRQSNVTRGARLRGNVVPAAMHAGNGEAVHAVQCWTCCRPRDAELGEMLRLRPTKMGLPLHA
jgi:hypothetical protein